MQNETNFDLSTFPGIAGELTLPSVEELLRNPRIGMETLRGFIETARAAIAATIESQELTATVLTDAQTKLSEIATVATQAVAASTQITDDQAVIAAKSDHIQKAQEHADKVRADLDRALTSATQQVTAAEAQKISAESAATNATEILEEIRTVKASVEVESAAVESARKLSDQSAEKAKDLADKSSVVEARIASYEEKLDELNNRTAEHLKTIIGLLPGATSAGLAHAFDERRKTFLKPHGRWQILFVGSVVAIVILAFTGLLHVYNVEKVPTYDELVRFWLARLPIAGALVWLALYASRESALARRLEEDYGYKSAIASCFEGFQRQMSEIGEGAAPGSPLAQLCANTLTTIAAPPGRIYERHKPTVSPTNEAKQIAEAGIELGKAAKPGK